jgi:hypothetical protein
VVLLSQQPVMDNSQLQTSDIRYLECDRESNVLTTVPAHADNAEATTRLAHVPP